MPIHRVQQGECLASIAARYGILDWQAVYDDAQNSELRKARPNPNILRPGDEVFIPERADAEQKKEKCATSSMHTFVVKIPTAGLRVVLRDADGEPFAGKKYVLQVGREIIEGTTGDDGLVEANVPLNQRTAVLSAWLYEDDEDPDPDVEYELELGHLDPLRSVAGVQARLQNLGFRCPIDDELGEETLAAIRRFRASQGLPEGEEPIDDALYDALEKLHEGA